MRISSLTCWKASENPVPSPGRACLAASRAPGRPVDLEAGRAVAVDERRDVADQLVGADALEDPRDARVEAVAPARTGARRRGPAREADAEPALGGVPR